MKKDPKALREERAKLIAEQRSILDASETAGRKTLDASEEERFNKVEAEIRSYDRKITVAEREESEERSTAETQFKKDQEDRSKKDGKVAEQAVTLAFDAYLRYGMGALNAETRSILTNRGIQVVEGNMREELRALTTGTGSSGGYLIPKGFSGEVDKALKEYGGMLEAARIMNTGTGNTIDWPTFDDTANKGRLLSENTNAASGSTDVAFGSKQIGAYTFTSDLILVPNQLLQDSEFNLNELLVEALAERLGRSVNAYMTTGTGSSQPEGVLVNSVKGADAAVSALTFDNTIDLLHSVNSAYRKKTSAKYMFSDLTLAVLRKLKDSEGRYIWQMGDVRTGAPDTLNGKPYIINDDMDAPGVSKKPVLFGDFSKFIIRKVQDISIRRLDERFADANQTAFVGFMRLDGRLLNTAAVKHILNAAS